MRDFTQQQVADGVLGLCDGTGAWWALWTELVTRAPRLDDEDTDGFARERGLDAYALRESFAPLWHHHVVGNGSVAVRFNAFTGPVARWPYGRRGVGVPAPTDACYYADGACSGACF